MRIHRRRLFGPIILLLAALLTGGLDFSGAGESVGARNASKGPLSPLHVDGNRLIDSQGGRVILRGVDRSGTEYACIQGWGIFDGPSSRASIKAMKTWRINGVNVGLNEDCWLGINRVKTGLGGAAYVRAIKRYVGLLEKEHIYPVIALFWEAPGTKQATDQIPMPDRHAIPFWKSVADTFKNDRRVIFRLKEEPFPDNSSDSRSAWACWEKGGASCDEGYPAVGMQRLITVIRSTGARNVIQVPGTQYANSMTRFLKYEPHDPVHNLMAVVDVYPDENPCRTVRCYDRKYAPILKRMPFMAGEFGESVNGNICSVAKSNTLMSWLDAHHSGYFAWVWDTWGKSCGNLSLILSYDGTPKRPNGVNFRDNLLGIVGRQQESTGAVAGYTDDAASTE